VFDQQGLSLDQAPPIRVILRFFLIGALWGMIAGGWLMASGAAALDPARPEALILVHMLTLGVLASFMLGALFQMLPVLAGVALPDPWTRAVRTLYPLMAGTLFLLLGFGLGGGIFYGLGALFLLIGLVPTLGMMLARLGRVADHSGSSRGMQYAVFNLLVLLALGVMLAGVRSGWWESEHYLALRTAHIGYGLLGWVGLLIVSVAFQVVEMFYVTPPYPARLTRWLGRTVTWLLAASLPAGLISAPLQKGLIALVLIGLMVHGGITLRRFSQRKRPLTDATVWFWRTGSVSLMLSMAAALGAMYAPSVGWTEPLAAVLFVLFALSVVFAMLYKIVPFLVWFHLNAQGYFTAPMMHEVIHPRTAMRHLWLHLAFTAVALIGLVWPPVWPLAGLVMVLSFGWVALAVYRAYDLYLHTQRTGERFSFPG